MTTAEAVAAEIRAQCGARKINQRELARRAGYASHNYVSDRLHDEKPFNLDDLDRIAPVFGWTAGELIGSALQRAEHTDTAAPGEGAS